MKVIFLKSVAPYRPGQVAEVAEGYAKNYLIPQGYALPATAGAIRESEQATAQQVSTAAEAGKDLEALFQVLSGATVHVTSKAAPTGTLYAAVTPDHVARVITEQLGHVFPPALRKQLPTLKHAGQHPVTLRNGPRTITFTIDV